MALTTPQSFLELLERSKLLDADQLAEARRAARKADGAMALAKSLVGRGLLTRWQASRLLAGRSSFFLGKYKLIDLLGLGGVGQVFVAQHKTMNRSVALQIITKPLGRDPAALEQFITEVRAVAALDHPNIVHAYDIDSEGDRYYLVMELVDGRDLQRIVDAEGPLDFERAADYIRQAADGLAHAHGRGLIHCDVKPANLLVNKQGVVKILGMGMARLIGRDPEATSDDESLPDAVDYLAPEQAVGGADVDHRADVYSLGCTLYFLLTGSPPFPEGTPEERMERHRTAEPRPIADFRAEVPEELVSVCARMMAKAPDDRLESAGEVSQALLAWQPSGAGVEPTVSADEAESAEERVEVGPRAGDVAHANGGSRSAKEAEAPAGSPSTNGGLLGLGRRKLLLGGLGGAAVLALLVGLFFLFKGPGDESKQDTGTRLAAGETQPRKPKAEDDRPSQKPSKPARTGDDKGQWRDLPDFGNLTTFDPEAFKDEGPRKSDQAKAKPKAEQPGKGKAEPNRSGPDQQEPDQAKSGKPKPDKPPDAGSKPKKTQEEPQPQATPDETDLPEEPKPASSQPEAPKPKTKKPDKEQPRQKEAAKPDKEQPKQKEAAKPAKDQPEQEGPEKPKPEKKQDQGPLRELAEAVDLPEFDPRADAGPPEPFTLGKIHSGPEVDWQLYLLGGENARRRNQKFVLQQVERDAAKASWLVHAETTVTGKEPTQEAAAKIWRQQAELMFQWVPDASASANCLRNCILQVRVEGKSKYQTLRTPKQAEPITMDLERGAVSATVPVKWLPDASNLRVEITKVEGRKGHSTDPPEPAVPRDPFELHFVRTDRHGNSADKAAFRLIFTPRSTAMSVRVQLLEPPSTLLRGLEGKDVMLRNQREIQRDQLERQLRPKDKDKAPRGLERSALLKQIELREKEMWYLDFYEEVHGKAKIHFRIFTEVDGRKLILATT